MSKKRGMGYQCGREYNTHDSKVVRGDDGRSRVITDVQRRCANVLRMAIRFGVPFTTTAMVVAYNARFNSNLSENHIRHALTRLRDEAECLTMNAGKEWAVTPRAMACWNSIEHKNRS
jgi:hypothetical protein